MFETLEARRLFSGIDTSSVALFAADGSPTTINRHRALWVLVHGANMSKSLMTDMAASVQSQLSSDQWQVLILDWSKLAYAKTNGSKNALAVGDKLAALLNAARVPAARVNLIGFSLGGTVIGRAARDLKTSTTQVNRIVGVDAAAGQYEPPDFAANSQYSICFAGHDRYGGDTGAYSADDAVLLTGLSANALQAHTQTFEVLTTIWNRDGNAIGRSNDTVSPLFSIQQILSGQPYTWEKNKYLSGYEAKLACGFQPGLPNDLGPLLLTYVDLKGRTRTAT